MHSEWDISGRMLGRGDVIICHVHLKKRRTNHEKQSKHCAISNCKLLRLSEVQSCSEIQVNRYVHEQNLKLSHTRAFIYSLPSCQRQSKEIVKSREDHKSHKPSKLRSALRPAPPPRRRQPTPHPNWRQPPHKQTTCQCNANANKDDVTPPSTC